jgi:hypothetical protein
MTVVKSVSCVIKFPENKGNIFAGFCQKNSIGKYCPLAKIFINAE